MGLAFEELKFFEPRYPNGFYGELKAAALTGSRFDPGYRG